MWPYLGITKRITWFAFQQDRLLFSKANNTLKKSDLWNTRRATRNLKLSNLVGRSQEITRTRLHGFAYINYLKHIYDVQGTLHYFPTTVEAERNEHSEQTKW